ncbi:RES family NAD+ phosphorylase [Streptomyces mauvecolor]|uniref:RES family NAD+ phosphorylase n=1 Tax=Streptomyces mauvecolor TaxID=58345 RepID=A0ABV9UWP5_9ACTN
MDMNAQLIEGFSEEVVQLGWRVHRRLSEPEFYFRGPSRFAPDQENVGVLYLASNEQVAMEEFIGSLTAVRGVDLEKYVLSELEFPTPLRLIDTTDHSATAETIANSIRSEDYMPSQAFATAAYGSGKDGIAFRSHSGGRLYAVFGLVGGSKEVKIAREVNPESTKFMEYELIQVVRDPGVSEGQSGAS